MAISGAGADVNYHDSQHGEPADHLQLLWHESGGDGRLSVKNSFLTVSGQHNQLPRSASWSGASSGTSSQEDSHSSSGQYRSRLETPVQPPAHIIFEASDSASGSERQPVFTANEADVGQGSTPKFGWSKGAALHDSGKCNPCVHLAQGPGCKRDVDCNFCHLSHEIDVKRARRRPCKASRNRYKRLVDELEVKYKDDPETKEKEMQRLVSNHPYMRSLLMGASGGDRAQSSQAAVPGKKQDSGQNPDARKSSQNILSL